MSDSSNKSIGIYGGSFDPPHVGHVLAVQYVLLTQPLQKMLVIPCSQHPFGKGAASFDQRFEMCLLAFAGLGDKVEVLDIERQRPGPSYTIDTVREVEERYPAQPIMMVIGSDLVPELPKWKDSAELLARVNLLVLPRLEEMDSITENDQQTPFYLPRISSSALRKMIAERRDVSPHVPRAVLAYIQDNRLYL